MRTDDTIVAISTPLGQGGLGVLRLSGPQSLPIAARLFQNPSFNAAASHTLHHGWIKSQGKVVDEAVAGFFRAPKSYTGEDVVEISCHGSPVVLKEVLRLAEEAGARLADPGEFTQRAYTNGKLDLLQAEAVAELISARSASARGAAAEQLRGVLSQRMKRIRGAVVDLLAHMEANLDFVEEDIPGLSREKMKAGLTAVAADIEALLATSLRGRWLREGVRVALVGKPNVGKSSLFNALLAHDRAIVSDIPGTTRDTLEEHLEWDGWPVVLTDTAGLRDTADAVEQKGTERALRASSLADVTALVLDLGESLTDEDRNAAARLKGKNLLVVLNKSDRPAKIDPASLKKEFPPVAVRTSALKGEGLVEFKRAVLSALSASAAPDGEAVVVTNARHVRHLEKAAAALTEALRAAGGKESEEALSVPVREALKELSAITGESVTEDVLTSIFSRFCIGK